MSYTQERRASFRGVEFFTYSESVSEGRRIKNHKYAFSDKSFNQDLGRDEPVFSISGFIAGNNVDQQRISLTNALNRMGVGKLVHPTLGTIDVVALEFTHSSDTKKIGIVNFEMKFMKGLTRSLSLTAGLDTLQSLIEPVSSILQAVSSYVAAAYVVTGVTKTTTDTAAWVLEDLSNLFASNFQTSEVTTIANAIRNNVYSIVGSSELIGSSIVSLFSAARVSTQPTSNTIISVEDLNRSLSTSRNGFLGARNLVRDGFQPLTYAQMFTGFSNIYANFSQTSVDELISFPNTADYIVRNNNIRVINSAIRVASAASLFEALSGKRFAYVTELEIDRTYVDNIYEDIIDDEATSYDLASDLRSIRLTSYNILYNNVVSLPRIVSYPEAQYKPLGYINHMLYSDSVGDEQVDLSVTYDELSTINRGKSNISYDDEIQVFEGIIR